MDALEQSSESDPEDILSSSLGTLYDYTPITHSSAGSVFTYKAPSDGPTITLLTPDTQASNWHLHASSIWVSALFLADHLAELQLHPPPNPICVLELGASAGLPGILLAKTHEHARVTVSDYPDEELLRALSENVARNGVGERCRAVPYAWGTNPALLLSRYPESSLGYDVVIAADTLWNPELHPLFIESLTMSLRRTADARVHLVAGLHTGRYTVESFLKAVQIAGLDVVSATERAVEGDNSRSWSVSRAEGEDERERRKWVVWIVLRWNMSLLL